jgi:uncharacterized protein YecT (DUF1311 family)
MIRLIGLVAALLLLALPAQAASFDCAKATTPFEKAICASPEASLQDENLAQAYATALGGLSKAAAAEITSTQKAWLGYAERACSEDAQPIAGDYSDDQKQCLAGTFRMRVEDLEASRMQGGYRFYPIDRYLVQKDTEALPEDFNKVADKAYHIVKIDRTGDVAAAFNAAIDGIIVGQGSSFFEPGTTTIADDDPTSDYDITTKVMAVTSQRISLQTNEYWYGHGAAHGNYFITNRHFLIGAKRLLGADDIFEGDDWEARLGALAVDKIKAQMGEDYFANSDDDVMKIAIDPLRWDFSEMGLLIQFNIYEVTAYAMGAPTITIPWSELEWLLADGAETIGGAY